MEKVIRVVIQYSNSQMIEPLYTWHGVNNALLRDQLSSQKKERALENAKAEADKILDSFDEDLRRLQKQITVPVLYFGNEEEFYQGEIKEMILDAIDEKMKSVSSKTCFRGMNCLVLCAEWLRP